MSEYTLHLGDCLEYMRTLPDGAFDAVVTDPPWNMGYFEDDRKSWGEYKYWLRTILDELERISRSGVWVFQSTKSIPYVAELFEGYMPFASLKNFSQMTPKTLPNCWDIAFYKVMDGYKGNGRNWFVCDTAGMMKERTKHPTPRTVDVMNYIIGMYAWDTIFDPFMGSGTTGVACMQLGRNFVGCEIDPEYFAIAEKRISEAAKQPPLFVPEPQPKPEQGSLFNA